MSDTNFIEGKIKFAPKNIRDSQTNPGMKRISFQLEDKGDVWFHCEGDQKAMENTRDSLKKGMQVEFEAEALTNVVKEFKKMEASKENDGGNFSDDLTSFEDLLAAAHKKFGEKISIESSPLMCKDKDGKESPMIDFEKKTAIFKARIVIRDGQKLQVFYAHGDATDSNIQGAFVKPHFIRMAETRAIARALRWATNNAACSVEETEYGELPEEKETSKK